MTFPLLLILVLSLPNTASAQPLDVIEVNAGRIGGVQVRAWTYPSDGLKVKGLLFLPHSPTPLPLVMFNHDGIEGISEAHKLACARLARAGYAVFAPSYRGEDGSEGQVEVAAGEVRDVLNVLPLLAQTPGIDRRHVALIGVSHGALISVLAAAQMSELDALVTSDGVMDIYSWWSYLKQIGGPGARSDALTYRIYGNGPGDKPQAFASRNALAVAPLLKVSVLILQAGRDDIVPPEQALRFKTALDKARVPAILKLYPNSLHAFLVYGPSSDSETRLIEHAETEQAWQTLLHFLDALLKPIIP